MDGPPSKRRNVDLDYKSESGLQLVARLSRQPPLENLLPELFQPSLEAKEVVEIVGESGTGQSQLLFHIIVSCIIPCSWKGIPMGGLDVGVVFIDNNCNFNIGCLATILHNKIEANIRAASRMDVTADEIEAFVKMCLNKLFLLQCFSSDQFRITLYSLHSLFMDNLGTNVLIIDSITTFYWWDRMMKGSNLALLDSLHRKITSTLKNLVNDCQLTLFATKQILMNMKKTEGENERAEEDTPTSPHEYDIMGRDWSSFVTRRIFLKKESNQHLSEDSFSAECYIKNTLTSHSQFAIKKNGIEFIKHKVTKSIQ